MDHPGESSALWIKECGNDRVGGMIDKTYRVREEAFVGLIRGISRQRSVPAEC